MFLEAKGGNSLRPLKSILEESLDLPSGENLEKLRGRDAVVLVDDYTRSTPVKEILPDVLERIRVGRVSIIVASGTHRRMNEKELEEKLGDIYFELPTFQHDPDKGLVFLGWTTRGTPVQVNRLIAKADVVVSISSVTPHNFYGWSGGAKIVLPGVAGRKTIAFNHRLAEHPDTRLGNPESPPRLDAEEAAKMAGLTFSINVVRNVEGRVVYVSSGEVVKAHRMAVSEAVKEVGVKASCDFDVTIVSSYPYDNDLWQAGKALFSAANVTRERGTIILLSPLREGVCRHYPQFERLLSLSPREIRREATRKPLEATVALQMKRMQEKFNCILVSSGVSREQAERMGFTWFPSLQEAVDKVEEVMGGKVSIIPNQLVYPYR